MSHEIKDRFRLTAVAYLDNVTLAGSVDKVVEALSFILTKGPSHCLHVDLPKIDI